MRHHYVPQFLLSPWAENNVDGKLEVFRFDLRNLSSSRHTPKFTGFEPDLYALTEDVVAGMERNAIEKILLMHIDNRGSNARSKLESHGLNSLTNEERVDWARFLMSLRIRQPEMVHQLILESKEHLRQSLNQNPEEYDELNNDGELETLEEWTENQYPGLIDNFGLSFFHELIDNPTYGNKILRMKWWMCDFNEVRHDLLLSDHPCIFTHGINDPNCVIALPISPKKAFMTTQNDNLANRLRQMPPRDLVQNLNEFSLRQASVRIFACNQSPAMRFIENRMRMRK